MNLTWSGASSPSQINSSPLPDYAAVTSSLGEHPLVWRMSEALIPSRQWIGQIMLGTVPPRIYPVYYICVPRAIVSDFNSSRKRIFCRPSERGSCVLSHPFYRAVYFSRQTHGMYGCRLHGLTRKQVGRPLHCLYLLLDLWYLKGPMSHLSLSPCTGKFKTLMLAYRTATGSAPTYFHSLITIYIPSRSLRSASKRYVVVPSQRGTKSLSRTFSFTVPGWWNELHPQWRMLDPWQFSSYTWKLISSVITWLFLILSPSG